MLEKWRAAAADEVNSTTPPTIPAAGSDGYPQDKDVGVKGTPIQAWWYHMIQGSLAAVVTGLGGTFGANVTALWAALAPRLSGILSHATDTGVVTTAHTRTVVGATSSQASATGANVSGGNLNTASGNYSAIHGGVASVASGDYSHISGGGFGVASGTSSSITGSLNVELKTSHALGGGYSLAPVITPSGANQNLSWLIKSDGGHGHLEGSVLVGGDVDAGTGAKVTIAGASGNIDADGALTVGKITALPVTYSSAATTWDGTDVQFEGTVNTPHGQFTLANPDPGGAGAVAFNTGTEWKCRIACDDIPAGTATVLAVVADESDTAPLGFGPLVRKVKATGGYFDVYLWNLGASAGTAVAWTVTVRYLVVKEG